MRFISRLKEDERGMMVFAMLAVVILLLSIFAGAYFAEIRSDSQRDIIDLAELKELERKIEKVEKEVENFAQEAGYSAVESVKDNIENDYSLRELKNKVGKRTIEIFEDKFEEKYSDDMKTGNLILNFHLRPLKENQTGIEFVPLYLEDERVNGDSLHEIPGFFEVKRMVHVNIENTNTGSVSTRDIDIESEVKTDFFILAEKMRNFDPTSIRKMVNIMVSGYLNIKAYDLAFEQEIGFNESFAQDFKTDWLEDYEPGDLKGGEKRENVWSENSTGFIEQYTRDEGKISRNSLISEDEFLYISKLALLLEQIRAFNSYDEALLETISSYFEIGEEKLLGLIGEGRNNKVNLQGLIITLFQKKDVLSEELFIPELFLKRIVEEDVLSIIEDSEEWTETTFGMMNDLASGDIDDQDRWSYSKFSENIESIEKIGPNHGYLRVLFSIFSDAMDKVFESFRVNSREVEDFVKEEIGSMEPLSWMGELNIMGEQGIGQITRSILHQSKNLSRSFGFEEGSYDSAASPFFYMYFLHNWGFESENKSFKIASEEIDNTGIHLGIQDKVKGELRSRSKNLENDARTVYGEINLGIESYNETEWYEGDVEQDEMWESLNKTLEPLQGLKDNRLFDENSSPYISDSLETHHGDLEERIEEVKSNMMELENDSKEYVEEILKNIEVYPGIKWRYETYEYLYDEGEGDGIQKNYLNLTDRFITASPEELTASYNWSLESYELAEDIEPGKRSDQSIGYRAIGSFTQEMVREFESPAPLDYYNPRNSFKLINQNLFDLKGPRDGEQTSRAMSILKGEGDPQSERLGEESLSDISVDFTEDVVSSYDLNEVDKWWDEIAFERSISSLEDIRAELETLSEELVNQNLKKEPYSDYADASFYRIANNFFESLINDMNTHCELISSKTRTSGYTYRKDGNLFRSPVISAPRGNLTLHESSYLEESSFSHPLDLEVDIDYESEDPIQLQNFSNTCSRIYNEDISKSQEWVNPFSEKYMDHYSTSLFVEYFTSGMEIQLSTGSEIRFVSERYSSSEITKRYVEHNHSSLTELTSPLPILEDGYTPRSVDGSGMIDASIEKNVFNTTEDNAELTLEVEEKMLKEGQSIVVEVLKKRDMMTYETQSRREVMNLHRIFDEEANQKTLFTERIPSEEINESEISFEFDVNEIKIPDDGIRLDHMIVRVKPEIELSYMEATRDLGQTTESEKELYSPIPSYSTSEQMYLVEEDRGPYLEVFRVGNSSDSELPRNSFDLVKDIPSDSWIIRKNGFRYLVEFSEDLGYRDTLSGTYRAPTGFYKDESFIDPRPELDKDRTTESSFIPENEYGYLLKNEFLPLYMSSDVEDGIFYPDRMVSLKDGPDRVEWNSLKDTFRSSGYEINLEKEDGKYLYYEVDGFSNSKRVNRSFERTERSIRESFQKEMSHHTFSPKYISQNGSEILRDKDMISDFAENNHSKRPSIFLASNFGMDTIEKAELLGSQHEDFTSGSIAKSIAMIGENRTEVLLEWLEEERQSSFEKELRAFMSFNDNFINDLPNRTGEESYEEAVDSLDEKLEDMEFVEYSAFSIKNLTDISSLEYLKNNFDDEHVSTIIKSGLKPSTLEEIHISYQIDLEKFADSIESFSSSSHLPSVIQESNSGDHQRMISLYMAGNFESSRIKLMPFGEDRPYILIDEDVADVRIKSVDSNSSVKEFIDESLKKAVDELPPERGIVLMEVNGVSSEELDIEKIESQIQKSLADNDPLYQNIRWVVFRVDGEIVYRHLHI